MQAAGWGAEGVTGAPCGPRGDFANGILSVLCSQGPWPLPPAPPPPPQFHFFLALQALASLSLLQPWALSAATLGPHRHLLGEFLAWQSQEAFMWLICLYVV